MVSTAIGNGDQGLREEKDQRNSSLFGESESASNVKKLTRVLTITCIDLLSMRVDRCYPSCSSLELKQMDAALRELDVIKT